MPRGVPQIEVSFDIDSNGILNVSAVEKSTGKSSNVTITNDKSRLTKEEIERMTQDAEKYEEEDKKYREKIEAKNKLEGYCFQIRSTLTDNKLKDKLDEDSIKPIIDRTTEVLQWLESNQLAEIEEFDQKRKELEEIFNPIMEKLYSSSGMPGMEGMPGMSQSQVPSDETTQGSSKIEEID